MSKAREDLGSRERHKKSQRLMKSWSKKAAWHAGQCGMEPHCLTELLASLLACFLICKMLTSLCCCGKLMSLCT